MVKTKIVGNGLDRSEKEKGTVKTVPYTYKQKQNECKILRLATPNKRWRAEQARPYKNICRFNLFNFITHSLSYHI